MNNLLEVLQAQQGDDVGQDGFTTKEVMKLMDCTDEKARELVRGLIESGQATPVKVKRRNMAGIMAIIVGYQLVSD